MTRKAQTVFAFAAAPEPVLPRHIVGPHVIACGNCLDLMAELEPESIDAIVTDPPYGLSHMRKQWDAEVPGAAFARAALRVLKPGGHLAAFSFPTKVHRLMSALEDNGFQLRDLKQWLFWSGTPKSVNVPKAMRRHLKAKPSDFARIDATYGGLGTGLRPSAEPIVLCRKPMKGTLAKNMLAYGTGALNVRACRLAHGDPAWPGKRTGKPGSDYWPGNIFYCPKPSPAERDFGTTLIGKTAPTTVTGRKLGSAGQNNPRTGMRGARPRGNPHPTIKPLKIVRFLVRLLTPRGGTVLDPYVGSGTTLLAAELEGVRGMGFELDASYVELSRARLASISDGSLLEALGGRT